ncbi:MAG: hypothetical protein WC889_19065, partial [Myxococcota bacterium]
PILSVGKTKKFSATVSGAVDQTIAWTVSAGTIDDAGLFTAPATAQEVTVTATSRADTSKSATTKATVVDLPAITSFTAAKAIITKGTATTLTAVFAGFKGTVDNNVGDVVSGTAKTTGNVVAATTFTLTVSNLAGEVVTAQTSIAVVDAPVAEITAPAFVTEKRKAAYDASVAEQTGATYLWTITGGKIPGAKNKAQIQFTAGDGKTVKLGVTVTNSVGDTATANKEPVVVRAPWVMSFNSTNNMIATGGTTKLYASFGDGTAVIDNGVGAIARCEKKETAALTQSTTFKITVTNPAGDSVSEQTVVMVGGAPIIRSFRADNPVVTKGKTTTLRVSYMGDSGEIDQGVGPVNNMDTKTTGVLNEDTTFTLTVHGTGDPVTKSLTVKAVDAPVATSIAADPMNIMSGESSKITAVFQNGLGVLHKLPDDELIPVESGVAFDTGPLSDTTLFMLYVGNEAGDQAVNTAVVIVEGKPQILMFLNPGAAFFKGQKVQTTAAYYGDSADVNGTPVGPPYFQYESPDPITTDTDFTITVKKAGHPDLVKTVRVTATDLPSITSFTADKTTITEGQTVKLTGVFDYGKGYISGESFPMDDIGHVVSGVEYETCPLFLNGKYKLKVTKTLGEYNTREVTGDVSITVNP